MNRKGPGKNYRNGISLVRLMQMFPDDETAAAWFVKQRWPEGIRCAYCESDNVQDGTTHPTMPYRCRSCRKFFSVKTGTVMQSSKLGCQVWALAIYLMTTGLKGTSSMKLHRDLNVTQKTAWHLAHRIRETWHTISRIIVLWPRRGGRNLYRRQGAQQTRQQTAECRAWHRRQDRCCRSQRPGQQPNQCGSHSRNRPPDLASLCGRMGVSRSPSLH